MSENTTEIFNVENLKAEFKAFVTAYIHRDGINSLMNWLDSTDFYVAPASTKYHGAVPGGLCAHSLQVFKNLLRKYESGESMESFAIVALFHDLCKVNFYKATEKTDSDGNVTIKYSIDDQLPMGHGEKSIYYIVRHMELTAEELLSIRWHMGAYATRNTGEADAMQQTLNKYKLALKLQQSDMEAAYWNHC